jgi:hypothetical protein
MDERPDIMAGVDYSQSKAMNEAGSLTNGKFTYRMDSLC